MDILTPIDIEARVRLASREYNSLLDKYMTSIKIGRKCSLEELNKLYIADVYINMLKDYIPLVCSDPTNDNIGYKNNCFTEEEIQKIADKLGNLLNINFKPIGYNYSDVPAGVTGLGTMQIGCSFIVS